MAATCSGTCRARTAAYDDRITRGNGAMRTQAGFNGVVSRRWPRRGDWQFETEWAWDCVAGSAATPRSAGAARSGATRHFGDALSVEVWVGHVMDQEFWSGGRTT